MKITCLAGHVRRVLFLATALLALVCARPAPAADSPSALVSAPGGWQELMPPADLKGWTRIAIPPTNALGRAQWHLDADRQILVCDGDGGHEMLRYDALLTNCIFHVECRFVPVTTGKMKYNSGIFIRNSADGVIWHQCQLTMNGGYLFGDTPTEGKLKRFMARAGEQRMAAAGEWNTVEVTAKEQTLSVWFNGAQVSQFATCAVPAGYVALESEGYAIEFRNLKLKLLP